MTTLRLPYHVKTEKSRFRQRPQFPYSSYKSSSTYTTANYLKRAIDREIM